MAKNKLLVISLVLSLFLLTYLAVKHSFTLALSGDDWLMHYTIWSIFDLRKEGSLLNPLSYLCTYCPHYFFLSIIKYFWDFNPFYYYLVSYFVKAGVAIILFFSINKLTKRLLIAYLASSFFAVSYLGIETTDWVFNFNHYLGVGFVAFFLVRYFKAKESKKISAALIAGLFFAFALIISPPRMHGLLPLVLLMELCWLFMEGKKYNFKKLIERLAILVGFYFFIIRGVGDLVSFLRDHSINLGADWVIGGYGTSMYGQIMNEGLNTMRSYILQGKTDFIIDPIASLGNYIIPGLLWNIIPFPTSFIFISLLYGSLTFFILYILGIQKKLLPFYFFNLLVWTLFIYLLQQINLNTFLFPRTVFAIIGGITVIFTIWLFFILKKTKPLFALTILLGFGWMSTFIIFPWLLTPVGIMLAWGRYSVQQSAGLAIWSATIFTLLIDTLLLKKRFFSLGIVYTAIAIFIVTHLTFTNIYLSHVNSYRSQELDQKYWKAIISKVPYIDKDKQSIFLLLTDQISAEAAEAIRFGFFGRNILYYDIRTQDHSPFMVVNEYDEVLSSVYDGKFLAKRGIPTTQPTKIDHVYAFYLENMELYNITDKIRKKLEEDVEALKKGNLQAPQTTP